MTSLDDFISGAKVFSINEFRQHVAYFAPMDFLMYLKEDVSFRSSYVDGILELLYHPYKEEVIGIKVCCAKKLVEDLLPELTKKMKSKNPLGTANLGNIPLKLLLSCVMEKFPGNSDSYGLATEAVSDVGFDSLFLYASTNGV